MKRAEEVLDSLYNFTESQKMKLEALAAQINSIKNDKISKDTYDTLTNVFQEVHMLRDNVTIRLLASMKRGDMI
jgi:DNA-directed RNA polymerase